MTEFFHKNLDRNDINKFYKSKLDQQIQSELEKTEYPTQNPQYLVYETSK